MKRCPQCSAFNKSNRLTCGKCGSELSESGFQADMLTYWDEQTGGRLAAMCSLILVAGVLTTIVASSIAPALIGLLLAGLYYVWKYKE
jgi:uncharacterized membrane protein YvbJ